jgi:hypothetical protein
LLDTPDDSFGRLTKLGVTGKNMRNFKPEACYAKIRLSQLEMTSASEYGELIATLSHR